MNIIINTHTIDGATQKIVLKYSKNSKCNNRIFLLISLLKNLIK